jgi:hypothetical protein
MNLHDKRRKWLHNIGQDFLNDKELTIIKDELNTLPIRKINSVISTIGTAAYLDGSTDYCKKARESNPMLLNKFPYLYEELLHHLSYRIEPGSQVKCQYAIEHDIAVPGFHIFPGKSLLGKGWNVASLHVDMQELQVPWPKGYGFDYEKTYSFTIPISVTRDSGLYIFAKKAKNINPYVPLCWKLRNINRQKIYYENGKCYLHHGKWFHLISPFRGKQETMYMDRITLQGHVLYCKTTQSYWIYW